MAINRDHIPDHGPDDSLIRNPEVSYERRDLGARGILVFLILLGISAIAIHFLIWGVYRGMEKFAIANEPELNPLVPQERFQRPAIVPSNVPVNLEKFPQPRLQADDVTDMETLLEQERRLLNAQPWKDESGTVHIPIDHAKRLIAQRGLPARNASAAGAQEQGAPVARIAPAVQTDSGDVMNEQQRPADASSVPGAPKSDATKPTSREEQKAIPGVKPGEPRNPSRGRGERQPR